jgi:Ca2+-binding RTX toxin-like protein
MPTVMAGGTVNPNMYNLLSVLEVFKGAYTATLFGTTGCTFTVGTVSYKVAGTGFALTGGKLSAGTITGIQTNTVGTVNGVTNPGQFLIKELSLAVTEVNAKAAQEGANSLALEGLLSGQNWTLTANKALNGYSVANGGLTGTNTWYLLDNNDTMTGGSGRDYVYGGNGTDSVAGALGNDRLYGDAGNDTLNGNEGNDYLYGGAGVDSMNGGDGADYLYGGTQDTLVNSLFGGDGNDVLIDHGGAGVLSGGNDDDKLYGYAGADSLSGGSGKDTLYGGSGKDELTGGSNPDAFVFSLKTHMGTTAATADQITDFYSTSDKINLMALGLDFVGTDGFTAATTAGEVRWDKTNTMLQIDKDGNNTVDYYIDLQAGANVVASDLIL